eukprot:1375781-Pyramimonas_sp.AAC.1
MAVHRRAHRALQEYATIYGALALPASELQLAHFLVWLLCLRDLTLDVAPAPPRQPLQLGPHSYAAQ